MRAAAAPVSHYQVLKRFSGRYGKFTLVAVKIETGRTHQIRVHMSSIGHPVVGDTLYGAPARIIVPVAISGKRRTHQEPEGISLSRNFLHSAELEFAHPRSGETLSLKSPLPEELKVFLRMLDAAAEAKVQGDSLVTGRSRPIVRMSISKERRPRG